MSVRIEVAKLMMPWGQQVWDWWCPCCAEGADDYFDDDEDYLTWNEAMEAAMRHLREIHPKEKVA